MKYRLSPGEITRAEPEGFYKSYISPYIPTRDIISKNNIFRIVLSGWAILEELIFRIALATRSIFAIILPSSAARGVFWYVKIILLCRGLI